MNTSQDCPSAMLSSFLEDSLPEQATAEIESHLESCELCRERLKDETGGRAFWSTVSELSDDQLDEDWLGAAGPAQPDSESKNYRESRLSAIFESVKPMLGPSDDPRSAGRIGNYEVTGMIGSGGMGVVLKAKDQSLDRVVAIKLLAPHLATFESSRQRFRREAKAAAAVKHDGIISIHGVDAHNGVPYFVMPYEAGPSLQQRIESQGPMSLEEALRVASQIASALDAAHQTGLVHRDIKPSNILLAPGTERALLTDFGLAQVCDQQNITQTGLVAGTPMFMSPEQARGESVDSRSDLFSLGSVIFMMLTGKPPVTGDTGYSIVRHIGGQPMPTLRSVDPDQPAWMDRLVSKLHSLNPGDRVKSALELTNLLNQSLGHLQNPNEFELPETIAPESLGWFAPSKTIAALAGLAIVSLSFIVAMGWSSGWLSHAGPNDSQHASPIPAKPDSEIPNEPATRSGSLDAEEIDHNWDDELDSVIQEVRTRLEAIENEQDEQINDEN